jgi:hypothetical protein
MQMRAARELADPRTAGQSSQARSRDVQGSGQPPRSGQGKLAIDGHDGPHCESAAGSIAVIGATSRVILERVRGRWFKATIGGLKLEADRMWLAVSTRRVISKWRCGSAGERAAWVFRSVSRAARADNDLTDQCILKPQIPSRAIATDGPLSPAPRAPGCRVRSTQA